MEYPWPVFLRFCKACIAEDSCKSLVALNIAVAAGTQDPKRITALIESLTRSI